MLDPSVLRAALVSVAADAGVASNRQTIPDERAALIASQRVWRYLPLSVTNEELEVAQRHAADYLMRRQEFRHSMELTGVEVVDAAGDALPPEEESPE